MAADSTIIVLLLILAVGLILPELFKRFRIPFVTTLIIAGAILGPQGLGYVQSNEIIEFFGFLGSTFLLLMVGLETKLSQLKTFGSKIGYMASINALIPFVVGLSVTRLLGYEWISSLMVGTVFMSSSIAIVCRVGRRISACKKRHRKSHFRRDDD